MTVAVWRRALPPFLVGLTLAVTGEVAAGLLLYDGPGFLPALSVLLAVVLAALGIGVLGGIRTGGHRHSDPPRRARRLWLQAIIAAATAMIFSAAWEIVGGFGATALSQAAGLLLLGALPFFTSGAVLGAMGTVPDRSASSYAHPGVMTPLGAAAGALVIGFFLFPAASPTTMLFLCALLLALAAQVHVGTLEPMDTADDPEASGNQALPV